MGLGVGGIRIGLGRKHDDCVHKRVPWHNYFTVPFTSPHKVVGYNSVFIRTYNAIYYLKLNSAARSACTVVGRVTVSGGCKLHPKQITQVNCVGSLLHTNYAALNVCIQILEKSNALKY